jgi:hypothetical protein
VVAQVSIRAATVQDVPHLLTINTQSTPGVAPLDGHALGNILAAASYFQVATMASQVAGYVIGYRSDASYEGEEFVWFRSQYPTFLYIDQVAVLGRLRGGGIGAHLYHAVEQWAQTRHIPLLTCEVHLDPPNPGSLRFHTRQGYHAVQELDTTDGRRVSLMVKRLYSD